MKLGAVAIDAVAEIPRGVFVDALEQACVDIGLDLEDLYAELDAGFEVDTDEDALLSATHADYQPERATQ